MKNPGFSAQEKISIAGLSIVIGLRMLGLSMIIPVFSVYAIALPDSTPLLAGVAFGIYGLTQALLQIPFGYMSDRFGRKPVVAGGLLLFGVGSVIAAVTTNIYLLIAARFLQGGGAIASACFAWISDLTVGSHRNMAMAFMGIAIGAGIVTGMIIGPMIGGVAGVAFLFWLAAGLSLVGVYITVWKLAEAPENNHAHNDFDLNPFDVFKAAASPDQTRLNITGFLVNVCMITTFFIVPLKISETFEMSHLWMIYLPLSALGGAAMMVSSRKADGGAAKGVITGSLLVLTAAFAILCLAHGIWTVLAGFALFFSGFSVLEATLPAAVSKLADPARKGAIIGVFNLSQFSGTFVGGIMAGWFAAEHASIAFAILCVATFTGAAIMKGAGSLSSEAQGQGN